MASATLEPKQNLNTDEWLAQAEEMIDRINATDLRHVSEEIQEELKGQLEHLLLSGEKLAENSARVRLLGPSLLYPLAIFCANQGDWLAAARHVRQTEALVEESVEILKASDSPDLPLYIKALEQLQQNSYPFIEARVALQSSENTADSGAWQRGLEELNEALKMLQTTNDVDGKANASLGIGNVHRNFGDYEIAQSYYWDAVRFFRRKGNKSGEATAQLRYGTSLIDQQNYKEAEPHLLSARELFAKAGNEDQTAVADKWLALTAQMEQSAGEKI